MNRVSNLFSSVKDVVSVEPKRDFQDVWERASSHMSAGGNFSGKVNLKGALLALLAVSGGASVMQRESSSVSDVAAGRLYDGSTLESSCVQGLVFGGVGSVLFHDPSLIWLGATGCFSGVGAQQPIGGEFQVNNYTNGGQEYPSVATFIDGNFVVTWHDESGHDGSEWGVYGQVFYNNANKLGPEFQVNTYTISSQNAPSVATFINGSFVVVWESWSQDGSDEGVYCQLFDGAANRIGNEFQANTQTSGWQEEPVVATFDNGNFVVAWHDDGGGGSFGIACRAAH